MMKGKKRFICPVCKHEWWARVNTYLSPGQFTQVGLISLFIMSTLYHWVGLRVLVTPLIIWGSFEFVRAWTNRRRLICKKCDFDPALYKLNPKLSRERCEKRLTTKAKPVGPVEPPVGSVGAASH